MAGNSNFPLILDTDTELYRVVPEDNLIPAMHNNHVDAIQSIEAALGVISDDDGAAGHAIKNSVAHYVGLRSTAQPNPYYPYLPAPTTDFRGNARAVPAAWTLGTSVTVDWDHPLGLCKIAYPNTLGAVITSANVLAGGIKVFIARLRCSHNISAQKIEVGFSTIGDGSDLDGIQIYALLPGRHDIKIVKNGAIFGGQLIFCYSPYLHVMLVDDGTDFTVYCSPDGLCWGPGSATTTHTGVPTTAVLRNNLIATTQPSLWLDLLSLGSAVPLGTG